MRDNGVNVIQKLVPVCCVFTFIPRSQYCCQVAEHLPHFQWILSAIICTSVSTICHGACVALHLLHITDNAGAIDSVYSFVSITFSIDLMKICWRHGESLSALEIIFVSETLENLVLLINGIKQNEKLTFK